MKKKKFKIEYPLSNSSLSVLWDSISTVYGLSEWFADDVNVDEKEFIFRWENFEQKKAYLLHSKANYSIRFQWEEDKGGEAYFEMRIVTSELSNDLVLLVTDFAKEDDIEDAILLWDHQVETLKRVKGM
ncbi:MAG TPA: START-like domain-containing protein [Paludibacter sp.]|jgi:hypothetical protein|nr:MAG: hypothetical protein BWY08_01442 [Bacteroidetes bacterium ADurb.Bin174]HQB28040.1 START-like domain-containing protein [Paludibacter sp.]